MKNSMPIIVCGTIVVAAVLFLTPVSKVRRGVGHRAFSASFESVPPTTCQVSYALVPHQFVTQIIENHPMREIQFSKIIEPTIPLEFDVTVISKETIPLTGESEYTARFETDTLLVVYEFDNGRREFQALTLPDFDSPPHVLIPPMREPPANIRDAAPR